MTHLSHDERTRLHAACEAAEKRTKARFELVTVPISDRYALYPIVYGAIVGLAAFGALVWQTARTGPGRLWVLAAMVALAVLIEGSFRLAKREIRLHE